MELPISDQVKLDFSNIHRAAKDKVVADKIKCIKMLSKNEKKSIIAKLLEITEKTIYNWRCEFLSAKKVEEFIAPPNKSHYRGKLSGLKKNFFVIGWMIA
jgi:hypothetical protein